MRTSTWTRWGVAVALAIGLAAWAAEAKAAGEPTPGRKIKVLMITGGHGYNEKEFPKIFAGADDIAVTFFPQKVGGEAFQNIDDWKYDVVLLYNFNQRINESEQANFLKLMDKGVGLIVLHHAMAAYPDWREFRTLGGGKFYLKPTPEEGATRGSGVKFGVNMKVRAADADHPITKGLEDFTIHEEAYNHYWVDPQAKVLLTTEEPSSDKVLAWAKTYRKARVFGMQLGHDEKAWACPGFRTVLVRAVRWTAGR